MRCCAEISPNKQCHNDVIYSGLLCEIHEKYDNLKIYDSNIDEIKFEYFISVYKPDDKCHYYNKIRCARKVCNENIFACKKHKDELTCDEFESYKKTLKDSVIQQHFKQRKTPETVEDFMKLSDHEKELRMIKNLKNRMLKANLSNNHAIDALIAATDDLVLSDNISTQLLVNAVLHKK